MNADWQAIVDARDRYVRMRDSLTEAYDRKQWEQVLSIHPDMIEELRLLCDAIEAQPLGDVPASMLRLAGELRPPDSPALCGRRDGSIAFPAGVYWDDQLDAVNDLRGRATTAAPQAKPADRIRTLARKAHTLAGGGNDIRELRRLVEETAPGVRERVKMLYWEGVQQSVIARILKITPPNVRRALHARPKRHGKKLGTP